VGTSSDTQGWFRSLHRPLGQLARKALNLLPKIDTKRYSVRSNQITALISKLFSLVILLVRKWGWNQWNDSIRSAVNRRILTNCPRGRCSERNHPWVSEDGVGRKKQTMHWFAKKPDFHFIHVWHVQCYPTTTGVASVSYSRAPVKEVTRSMSSPYSEEPPRISSTTQTRHPVASDTMAVALPCSSSLMPVLSATDDN